MIIIYDNNSDYYHSYGDKDNKSSDNDYINITLYKDDDNDDDDDDDHNNDNLDGIKF